MSNWVYFNSICRVFCLPQNMNMNIYVCVCFYCLILRKNKTESFTFPGKLENGKIVNIIFLPFPLFMRKKLLYEKYLQCHSSEVDKISWIQMFDWCCLCKCVCVCQLICLHSENSSIFLWWVYFFDGLYSDYRWWQPEIEFPTNEI